MTYQERLSNFLPDLKYYKKSGYSWHWGISIFLWIWFFAIVGSTILKDGWCFSILAAPPIAFFDESIPLITVAVAMIALTYYSMSLQRDHGPKPTKKWRNANYVAQGYVAVFGMIILGFMLYSMMLTVERSGANCATQPLRNIPSDAQIQYRVWLIALFGWAVSTLAVTGTSLRRLKADWPIIMDQGLARFYVRIRGDNAIPPLDLKQLRKIPGVRSAFAVTRPRDANTRAIVFCELKPGLQIDSIQSAIEGLGLTRPSNSDIYTVI